MLIASSTYCYGPPGRVATYRTAQGDISFTIHVLRIETHAIFSNSPSAALENNEANEAAIMHFTV
ncbi:hypothetical protein M404DRAFT_993275 [Pisolithus tinctorius Marx 270]|uniref:Uncharacterized protein n=1 Tax=Pisolithus tinctorius Marx 270 TaxID=870435 RepID=A0A0C3JX74_PISTI|nr:hypothetical protein M404DRAFT_993275 [Pisolithus tinctorius Marx 270]